MRLFVLILIVLDIILAEKQVINCHGGYQPYTKLGDGFDNTKK